jgi:hypothetical protein
VDFAVSAEASVHEVKKRWRRNVREEPEPLGIRLETHGILLEHCGMLKRRAVQSLTVFTMADL